MGIKNWKGTYHVFGRGSLEFDDVLSGMHALYGKDTADSDFNVVKFWGLIEDVRLTRIMLSLHPSNNPIARRDYMPTLQRINPPIVADAIPLE